MEMASQSSTNGLHSTENLSKLSNRSGEEVGEHETDVLTKIFTKEEEILLLKQITEAGKQSLCICKFCSIDRLKKIAYQVACEKKKPIPYPKSWNKNQQAESKWVKNFEERHKDAISKFLSICKIKLSQLSTNGSSLSSTKNVSKISNNIREEVGENNVPIKIFTEKEEILLFFKLLLLRQIKEEKQSSCICKSCSMDYLKRLAYKVACEKKKPYSKSQNKNQQVESEKWVKKFEERHKDEISKFPSICKIRLSQLSTSGSTRLLRKMFPRYQIIQERK